MILNVLTGSKTDGLKLEAYLKSLKSLGIRKQAIRSYRFLPFICVLNTLLRLFLLLHNQLHSKQRGQCDLTITAHIIVNCFSFNSWIFPHICLF